MVPKEILGGAVGNTMEQHKQLTFEPQKGCPVKLEMGNIMLDSATGRTLLFLRLQNSGHKIVQKVRIIIYFHDGDGNQIGTAIHTYNGLFAKQDFFGDDKSIDLGSDDIQGVRVAVERVFFSDNTQWSIRSMPVRRVRVKRRRKTFTKPDFLEKMFFVGLLLAILCIALLVGGIYAASVLGGFSGFMALLAFGFLAALSGMGAYSILDNYIDLRSPMTKKLIISGVVILAIIGLAMFSFKGCSGGGDNSTCKYPGCNAKRYSYYEYCYKHHAEAEYYSWKKYHQ